MVFAVIYIVFLFILIIALTVYGFIVQRERYWTRIWEEYGKPDVRTIEELKSIYLQNSKDKIPNNRCNVKYGGDGIGKIKFRHKR